jgi:hypothetical protein
MLEPRKRVISGGWRRRRFGQVLSSDVAALCLSLTENALVLCVDEKSQIQALDRTAPCLPLVSATPAG